MAQRILHIWQIGSCMLIWHKGPRAYIAQRYVMVYAYIAQRIVSHCSHGSLQDQIRCACVLCVCVYVYGDSVIFVLTQQLAE